jgi:hypothetical protein
VKALETSRAAGQPGGGHPPDPEAGHHPHNG